MRGAGRPIAFALFLFLPQLAAFACEFALGFRPFTRAPGRVPLAWDMFAVRIERCEVEWDPAVSIRGREVHRLRDGAPRFEWFAVRDAREAYDDVAREGCAYASSPGTKATVTCFLPDGNEASHVVECP